MSIKAKDFEKFLTKFKADGPCPVCTNDRWGITTQDNEESVMKVTMPDTELQKFLAYYNISCSVCGFTKSFHSHQVEERISEFE